MARKEKRPPIDDIEEFGIEFMRQRVKQIFRDHPDDYIDKLEEIGFTYCDDEGDKEEIEELAAEPETRRQWDLVAYFEGQGKPTKKIFEKFSEEKASENPNYPLIRRYFRQANQNLKGLLIHGLDHYPGRIDLLDDLAYYHEFEQSLAILIKYYIRACLGQANLDTFTLLAQDFFYATHPDGYEAYHALREVLEPGTQKRKIIDFLIVEEEEAANKRSQSIEF